MSDEHAPDEQALSKRERQKQRRQRKLEAQRAEATKARRKRTISTVLIVALVLGAVGAFGYTRFQERQERQREIEEGIAQLQALGCTEIEEMPILPSQHLSGADEELRANPPEVLYPQRPATSGRHLSSVVQSGVYDKLVDERILVHNLEHGYVTMFYDLDAPEEQVQELKDFAAREIEGGNEKIIVSAWKAELPEDGNFSWAAWGARQICRDFHPGVALNFVESYIHLSGNAPERSVQAHRGGTTGGTDPDETEGDLLLPPLGEPDAGDFDDAMEEPGEDGEIDPDEDAPPPDDDEVEE